MSRLKPRPQTLFRRRVVAPRASHCRLCKTVTSLYSLDERKAGDTKTVRHPQEFRECSTISTATEDLMNKNMRTRATRQDLDSGLSRREFARRAALAAAGIAVAPGSSMEGPPPEPQSPSGPAQQASSDTGLSPAAQAEVESKVQFILQKYGSRLNETQKADIQRLVKEGQKPLEKLRAYALENSDAPALVLRLERAANGRKD